MIMESNIENSGHYRNQSDADSQTYYSPQVRFETPFRSDDDDPAQDTYYNNNNSSPAKAPTSPGIFSVRKYLSPLRSTYHQQKSDLISLPPPPPPPPPMIATRRTEKVPRLNGRPPGVVAARTTTTGGGGGGEDLEQGGSVTEKRRTERLMKTGAMAVAPATSPRKLGSGSITMAAWKKMELWFRILEIIACVISFSIMASDKNQGWTGDSFDRYKEYRYCVAVTVAGFAYATFQACCAAYKLVAEKQSHLFGCYFDFAMDQTLAYLLISASSAAATRVDDWVSNWGKDQFTEKATASITTSFIAFALFAVSSLISGHNLCTHSY